MQELTAPNVANESRDTANALLENATMSLPVTPLSVPEEHIEVENVECTAPDLDNTEESILSNNDENTIPEMSIIGDLLGYKYAHVDIMLANMYDGEYVRDNNGTHLVGGIEDNAVW